MRFAKSPSRGPNCAGFHSRLRRRHYGLDVGEQGYGAVTEQRLYQLIRQTKPGADQRSKSSSSARAPKRLRSRSADLPIAILHQLLWKKSASGPEAYLLTSARPSVSNRRSRNAAWPFSILSRASAMPNQDARSISGNDSRRPDRGGHSISNVLL